MEVSVSVGDDWNYIWHIFMEGVLNTRLIYNLLTYTQHGLFILHSLPLLGHTMF